MDPAINWWWGGMDPAINWWWGGMDADSYPLVLLLAAIGTACYLYPLVLLLAAIGTACYGVCYMVRRNYVQAQLALYPGKKEREAQLMGRDQLISTIASAAGQSLLGL
eukprot:g263.t1